MNTSDVPLFDSLTHPMPTGQWLNGYEDGCAAADRLCSEMAEFRVTNALAVGMGPDIGGYNLKTYATWVRDQIPGAFPVAYCDPLQFTRAGNTISRFMHDAKSLGYVGIKLHPRFGDFTYKDSCIRSAIQAASSVGLFSMLCTYCYGPGQKLAEFSLSELTRLLDDVGEARLILVHGGLTNILEWSEAIRGWPNTLLDLSFTLQRFAMSSLDADIRCLLHTFDQRLCIGSDFPQYSLGDTRSRFNTLTGGLDTVKIHNVAYRNLSRLVSHEQ